MAGAGLLAYASVAGGFLGVFTGGFLASHFLVVYVLDRMCCTGTGESGKWEEQGKSELSVDLIDQSIRKAIVPNPREAVGEVTKQVNCETSSLVLFRLFLDTMTFGALGSSGLNPAPLPFVIHPSFPRSSSSVPPSLSPDLDTIIMALI